MSTRLARLERAIPPSRRDTPDLRRAYCRDHGIPEDSVLVGFGGPMVIVLPEDLT